ncbi:MAG: aspartyl/asparaginyl beta-hydroxylase domain-containing protein [Hyphomonadaceae bacterium]|nr:aspartyl/asparaginyl beta-hydroxylase domain-containing protein [Hyphomonadaceae bacterium]
MSGTTAAALLEQARASGARGDVAGQMTAVDRVLAAQPQNAAALLMKADILTKQGDLRGAVAFYAAVTRQRAAGNSGVSDQDFERARGVLDRFAHEFEDHIRAELAAQGFSGANLPARFSRALDILVGKKRAYQQQPRHLFVPELAPVQFFERKDFPFLDRVEAAFGAIRAELEHVIATATGFEPYVKAAANRPPSTQRGLVGNEAWSAFFLIKDGEVTPGGEQCPATLEALSEAPVARIPNHSPLVLFSKLAGGAHIPPHTGMINTRLICHLPLIAPPGCHFRVGNELRTWEEGKAWVFDDTIEHEAWNNSGQERTILLFDIWRPDLSADEREAFSALCVAIEKYSPIQDWH